MTDEANLNLPQVVRITADIPAGVASQLSEVATLMNANRPTALHEAIVLTNLLYSEAAKRGKVVAPQGSMQKVIYLPKVPREIAEHFGIPQGPMSLPTQITGKIQGAVSATRSLFGRGRAGLLAKQRTPANIVVLLCPNEFADVRMEVLAHRRSVVDHRID